MTGADTEFRLLGPVEMHQPRTGSRVVPPGAKQRALLATLVVEAGHTVSVERLADELWATARRAARPTPYRRTSPGCAGSSGHRTAGRAARRS